LERVVHHQKEPYDVFIARPSKWGNPFKREDGEGRQDVIEKYREYIKNSPLMDDLHELKGKTLGCWCAPKPCHGDVLLELLAEQDNSLSDLM